MKIIKEDSRIKSEKQLLALMINDYIMLIYVYNIHLTIITKIIFNLQRLQKKKWWYFVK